LAWSAWLRTVPIANESIGQGIVERGGDEAIADVIVLSGKR
jgi:hypothetical protein